MATEMKASPQMVMKSRLEQSSTGLSITTTVCLHLCIVCPDTSYEVIFKIKHSATPSYFTHNGHCVFVVDKAFYVLETYAE